MILNKKQYIFTEHTMGELFDVYKDGDKRIATSVITGQSIVGSSYLDLLPKLITFVNNKNLHNWSN